MRTHFPRCLALRLIPLLLLLLLLIVFLGLLSTVPAQAGAAPPYQPALLSPTRLVTETYTNPLEPAIPGTEGVVESCADPAIIRGQEPDDDYWYIYCTTDPLNGEDRNGEGGLNFHLIPILRSRDLVNWTYMGDAFTERPSWADPTAGLWAPDIQYFNGQYYLYYGVTDVRPEISGEPEDCHDDNAIGVAVASDPLGPWTPHDSPVIAPRRAGDGCNFFWTFDPDVLTPEDGENYIYYGSYYGGIEVRPLSEDGFTTEAEEAVQVAIPNRYEGAEVVEHDGMYYLFVSATNCCVGPLTGYSVFAGRSDSPTGPFVDREGVSFLNSRVGGTPVLSMNGNRWVGPGHNDVFTDLDGQTWTVYHAIDRFDPYFEGEIGFTKRPLLMDPIVWVGEDGWPMVRGGFWASDEPMPAPAAQPGETTEYEPEIREDAEPGELIASLSDEFTGTLGTQWEWVREPPTDTFGVTDGTFRFETQAADLYVDRNDASVLIQPLSEEVIPGEYMVETRVRLDLPPDGCCHNFVQAGLVIYGGDDNYIKLVHVSIWETRQTEFAKELYPVPEGYPRYGNTVVGPPDEWTYLRIVKREQKDEQEYTAYTSRDGITWVRGGTWTHQLGVGEPLHLGLVSMGGEGFTANFDYVRVYTLEEVPTAVTLQVLAVDNSSRRGQEVLLVGTAVLLTATLVLRRRSRIRQFMGR